MWNFVWWMIQAPIFFIAILFAVFLWILAIVSIIVIIRSLRSAIEKRKDTKEKTE